MKSVLVRMSEYEHQASETEKGVIRTVLGNPQAAAQCNIHQLAALSYVSASTVVRLCKKLGFAGYRELSKTLIGELAVRNESLQRSSIYVSEEDSLEQIVDKVTFRNITSLESTKKLISMEELAYSVDLICRCDTLNLFGIGASYLVAQDAYLKFLRVDKRCNLSEESHSQYLHAINMKAGDLALVISYSGRTEEVNKCAKRAREAGAPVIAITRFGDSPLSRLADCNLYIAESEEQFRSGAMPSRIASLNIIDILYSAYINRNYEESVRRLERTQITKEGRKS